MPGPAPKRADERSARAKTPAKTSIDVEVLPACTDPAIVPAPPPGLPADVAGEWAALWASPIAATIATTDLPALRRLYRLRSQHHQLLELAGEALLSLGSQGQVVLHPALKAAKELEPAICALEDRFGLSLRARQSLGIRMGALADVAKRHPDLVGTPQEDQPRADPRVAVAPAAAPKPRRHRGRLDGGEPPPQ